MEAESLRRSDRVSLASAQGRLSDLRGDPRFVVRWTGSTLPWFLRPLGLILSAGRYVVELKEPSSAVMFVRSADLCFTVTLCWFSRSLLPNVMNELRSGGWDHARGAANQDPEYAELEVNCDADAHDRLLVLTRCNRNCPRDLVEALAAIENADF